MLGISSGAKLAVSLVMIFLLSRGVKSSSALLIGAAFVGAMLAMGLILLISRYVDQMCDDRLHLLGADGFSRHVRR